MKHTTKRKFIEKLYLCGSQLTLKSDHEEIEYGLQMKLVRKDVEESLDQMQQIVDETRKEAGDTQHEYREELLCKLRNYIYDLDLNEDSERESILGTIDNISTELIDV